VTIPNTGTKKNSRERARETARLQREQEKKRQRRNRLFLQGGIGAVIVAAVIIVVVVITSAGHSAPAVSAGQSPKNMATGGIVFEASGGAAKAVTATAKAATKLASASGTVTGSSSVPHVVTFIDWSCPVCKQFEAAYSSKLQSLVSTGAITLEIHPIAILDRSFQGTRYSSRAANAAACIANFEPQKFLAAQTQFYDNQPTEGTTGLTNSQILGLIGKAGATTNSVTACVNSEHFKSWVTSTTSRTTAEATLVDPTTNSFGTPTVFINGKRWAGTTDLLTDIASAS
jgi:protein-disulfide isomerase